MMRKKKEKGKKKKEEKMMKISIVSGNSVVKPIIHCYILLFVDEYKESAPSSHCTNTLYLLLLLTSNKERRI